MSFPINHRNDGPAASTRRTTCSSRRARRLCRIGLIVVALPGIAVIVTACGGGSPKSSAVGLSQTTTTSRPSAARGGSAGSRERIALAYVNCMRTHGEPNMPDPTSAQGGVQISVTAGSGVDPSSPKFARATNACKHLLTGASTRAGSGTLTAGSGPQRGAAGDCLTADNCYAPRQFLTAYGIVPLLERGITGRGVTVVLPEQAETGPARPQPITEILRSVTDIRRDLADFDRRFRLPPAHLRVIRTLAGASASPWLAGVEEVEDTELVHAVAPDATIRELPVNLADVSTPAKLAATFARDMTSPYATAMSCL